MGVVCHLLDNFLVTYLPYIAVLQSLYVLLKVTKALCSFCAVFKGFYLWGVFNKSPAHVIAHIKGPLALWELASTDKLGSIVLCLCNTETLHKDLVS